MCSDAAFRGDAEHPWDLSLRQHVVAEHKAQIVCLSRGVFPLEEGATQIWDVYKESVAVIERRGVPTVGPIG